LVLELDDPVAPLLGRAVREYGGGLLEGGGYFREEAVLALEELLEVCLEVVSDISPNGIALELAHPQMLVLAEKLPEKALELHEKRVG
jgi:hypothetical protein